MFDEKGPTFLELARQALSGTTEGYDMLAPKFEYTPFRTPDELLGPMAEAVAEESVERALDACCGNGAIARSIAGVVAEQVVGIDVSAGMLEEARRLANQVDGAQLEFREEDVFTMNYDREFDVVATAGAFGHILADDQENFVDRVWRALTPGGRFIFVTSEMPSPSSPGWWAARGFNAAMHIRNLLIDPPFIMFYLTFTVERASKLLWDRGFQVEVRAPYEDTPFKRARLVIATRPQSAD